MQNIGATGSLLNWTINTSLLTWGTWSFTPEFGENLTPEDGTVTVGVSVRAPNETNAQFEGYLLVENKNNPDDFELIPVTLITPAAADSPLFHWSYLQQLLLKIKTWFVVTLKVFIKSIIKHLDVSP